MHNKDCSSADWFGIEIDPGLAFALWLRRTRFAHNMTLAEAADRMGVKYLAGAEMDE